MWPLHRERRLQSCDTLAIPVLPGDIDTIVAGALPHAPSRDCILKLIVTRGEGGRGYTPPADAVVTIITQWHPLPAGIQDAYLNGIASFYCDHPLSINPHTAGIKHLNRLDQVLASIQLARAADAVPAIKEGLMCDVDGYVLEGTRTNLFAVIDGKLCTPDLSRAGVAGVMRTFLLQQFNAAGVFVEVGQISKNDLRLASELFVCNSVLGIWPVTQIQQFIDGEARIDVEYSSRRYTDLANHFVQAVFHA